MLVTLNSFSVLLQLIVRTKFTATYLSCYNLQWGPVFWTDVGHIKQSINCWHFNIYEHDNFMLSCAEHEITPVPGRGGIPVQTIHLLSYLFVLILYLPVNNFSAIPGLNQAEDKVPCSRTQHSASRKVQTGNPSIPKRSTSEPPRSSPTYLSKYVGKIWKCLFRLWNNIFHFFRFLLLMSLVARKPVSDQVIPKTACSATETS